MNCPLCRQTNAPERNFCGSCGGALSQFCRGCGFRNLAADRYCGGCGASLLAAQGAAAKLGAQVVDEPPSAASPRSGGMDESLAELLEAAAQDDAGSETDESNVRVNQDDIDSLFGE